MFSGNNKDTRSRSHWHHSGVFIYNFEHVLPACFSSVSIVDFEHEFDYWISISHTDQDFPRMKSSLVFPLKT